jgi:alpha-glucosidase (family GH31 glycosyl hydrolase)
MSRRTSEYFQNLSDSDPRKDKRHFIVGRSTFTGTGKYASHWLGDNHRTYAFMNYSIAGIMNFNMFGIPHVGADVCGFFGNARNDKLCSRWA